MSGILSNVADRLPSPSDTATAIGAGRLVISAGLFVAPTAAVRGLGVDTASAKRMTFLVRMTAVRDAGLGVGTLASRGTAQLPLWLALGAAADAVDALVIAAATKQGVTRGVVAVGTVLGAAGAAAAGAWAAAALT